MRKPVLIAIVLLTTGAIALGLFAWRESQRATAIESLLMKDYASFVADNFVRFSAQLYLERVGMTRSERSASATPLALLRDASAPLPKPHERFVAYFFKFDRVSATIETSGRNPDTEERTRLSAILDGFDPQCAPHELAPFSVIADPKTSGMPIAGYVQTGADGKVRSIKGMRLEPQESVEAFFKSVIETPGSCECGRTLLPASLISITDNRQGASFVIRDESRSILLATEPRYDVNSRYTLERPLSADMPFKGWTVAVTMNPAVVRPLLPYRGTGAPWLALAFAGTLVLGSGLLGIRSLRRDAWLWRLRQDFISNVSHELKTPLTRIRLFNELMLVNKEADPAKSNEYRSIIDRECRRLGLLVENILDFSKHERGAARKAEQTQIDLRHVVEEALDTFRAASDPARFSLRVSLEDVPTMVGDATALQRAVINLLDNAVKYSGPGSTIDIELKNCRGSAQLCIRDSGCGIPETEQNKIFEEFYRVQTGDSQRVAGSGLGLALVRRAVEAHKGQIRVESRVGAGSAFTIELPLAMST